LRVSSDLQIRITDVSPRDGLQNEPTFVPTTSKLTLIAMLAGTGVDEVECTSFVSPKAIPQLADAAEIVRAINAIGAGRQLGVSDDAGDSAAQAELSPAWSDFLASPSPCAFSVLVPNSRGMQQFTDANCNPARPLEAPPLVQKIAVFTSASEAFCQRNIGCTIAESMARFAPVIAEAQASLLSVRGYISCITRCPISGDVAPGEVARLAEQLLALGCDEIDLGDTIGAATPSTLRSVLDELAKVIRPGAINRLGQPMLVVHLHDTFGQAHDCVRAALQQGVRSFDSSVAGLGGCPYASAPGKPAPGNISTEDLLATLTSEGFVTSVSAAKLREAATFAMSITRANPASSSARV